LTFPIGVRARTNSSSRTFGLLVLAEAKAAIVASLGPLTLVPHLFMSLGIGRPNASL
jgi:hypothetical protein